MRKLLLSAITIFLMFALIALTQNTFAYNRYNGSPACDDCHNGFVGGFGNPLHNLHLTMTSTCTNCHGSTGDNPRLQNCAGCHLAEGLRLHHANAGAPADANGLFCSNCHNNDPAPAAESVIPPYYGTTSSLQNPCLVLTADGGEDYDGDGFGLDNDGDLLYDQNDGDCATPVQPTTWGRIKALFNE